MIAYMGRTYAVTWRDAEGASGVGRLEFAAHALRLEGPDVVEVPYGEIVGVGLGRGSGDRVAGRSSLVVKRANGRPIWIVPVTEGMALHELEDRLTALAGPRLSA